MGDQYNSAAEKKRQVLCACVHVWLHVRSCMCERVCVIVVFFYSYQISAKLVLAVAMTSSGRRDQKPVTVFNCSTLKIVFNWCFQIALLEDLNTPPLTTTTNVKEKALQESFSLLTTACRQWEGFPAIDLDSAYESNSFPFLYPKNAKLDSIFRTNKIHISESNRCCWRITMKLPDV